MVFRQKFHIGVDHETGLVHTLQVTSDNVSDVAEVINLLHGDEGYQDLANGPTCRPETLSPESLCCVPGKLAKLTKGDCEQALLLREAAHEPAGRRAKVEHVFCVIWPQITLFIVGITF